MDEFSEQSARYRRIERALGFMESNFRTQPDLDEIARSVHLSRFHFDRLLKDWVGITPLQFLHYLTLDYAKKQLLEAQSVLDAAIDAGLSGPGRLHDLFVTFEAMSPGEFKKSGAGLTVSYGLHPTPFGTCLLARTDRGICHLTFLGPTEDDQVFALQQLSEAWPLAHLREDREKTGPLVEQIFSQATGNSACRFHLLLKGTSGDPARSPDLLSKSSRNTRPAQSLPGSRGSSGRQPTGLSHPLSSGHPRIGQNPEWFMDKYDGNSKPVE